MEGVRAAPPLATSTVPTHPAGGEATAGTVVSAQARPDGIRHVTTIERLAVVAVEKTFDVPRFVTAVVELGKAEMLLGLYPVTNIVLAAVVEFAFVHVTRAVLSTTSSNNAEMPDHSGNDATAGENETAARRLPPESDEYGTIVLAIRKLYCLPAVNIDRIALRTALS